MRSKILLKLSQILPSQRLLPRWNLLPILLAQDPEAENIGKVGGTMGGRSH